MNAAALVTLLLGLVDRAAQIGSLLSKAKAEGRDITKDELDAAFDAEKLARAELQAAVDAARANTSPKP